MQTRAIHRIDESTSSALSERKCGKTYRVLSDELGEPKFSIGTLHDVLNMRPGAMTLTGENELRRRLGLTPLTAHYSVEPCPTCGGDHGLKGIPDCHGREVLAVVTLAPGEVVVNRLPDAKPKRTRKPDDRGTLHVEKALIAKINERRRVKGLTQAELVEKALIAYDLLEECE